MPNDAVSVGVGDFDVTKTQCNKCQTKDAGSDNVFNFDLKILNPSPTPPQQAILCHYCGNKVNLDDTQHKYTQITHSHEST